MKIGMSMILYTLCDIGVLAGLYFWAFRSELSSRRRLFAVTLAGVCLMGVICSILIWKNRLPGEWLPVFQTVMVLFLLWPVGKKYLEGLFVLFFLLNYLTCSDSVTRMAADYLALRMPPYGAFFTVLLVTIAAYIPLLIYFRLVMIPIVSVKRTITRTVWLSLWLIPAAFFVIACYNSFYYFPVIFRVLNVGLGMFVCLVIGDLLKDSEEAAQSESGQELLILMEKQYEGIRERLEQVGRLRHDMRHFMVLVNDFIGNEDLDGLRNYMLEYSTMLAQSPLQHVEYCHNHAINVVAGYYLSAAEREGIDSRFDCRIEADLPLTNLEISGVLGNLLENALEACRRMESDKKYMFLSMRSEGNYIVIVVENSYNGMVRQQSGRFWSSKRDSPGCGLESVRNLVEKKGGVLKIEYEQGYFRVNILFG